ncbi:diguanylate cyclase (GGDEF)-like protein [Caldalkalibacillus uzonensis]|uniref:Diguanylate cyclase (GGDEF)-like protein n=1 Tax=Caldalkalibacillus uzonensis TaxID=353224 RepID=A0ABU0CXT6_9BACI|nr:diguanylate cyclase [Caldalkalibacillus uzonensis]MDQ0340972.1 diguanylate cyclase (GGDEF)-like protein [Caldalkalibacillus uzonensis]
MQKYHSRLRQSVKHKLQTWFDQHQPVPKDEVELFLHALAAKARTVSLHCVGSDAVHCLKKVQNDTKQTWPVAELKQLLQPIISFAFSEQPALDQGQSGLEVAASHDDQVVLIADEDTSLLVDLKDYLTENKGYHVLVASSVKKALATFYDLKPDCLVTQIELKDELGHNLLTHLKPYLDNALIPTVVMSEDNSKQMRIRAYELGADDFLPKPVDREELAVRLERHLTKKKQLSSLLLTDELTGVYNRRFLQEAFRRLLAEHKRQKQPLCMVVLDVDHFKMVNDTYGHVMGDKVLQGLAQYLQEETRAYDVVARLGGEEFALLLPRTKLAGAMSLMNRILRGLSQKKFEHAGRNISLTFSAGVVEVDVNNESLAYWLEVCDQALYEAKQQGRARVVSVQNTRQEKNKQIKIAVVDDDPVMRTIVVDLLKKIERPNNFTLLIEGFEDGLTFLQSGWADKGDYHIVFLDGIMPKMDGLEVLYQLKKSQPGKRIMVIMLTGRKGAADIQRALELGADDYLTKPFKPIEILSRAKQIIQRVTE